MTSAADQTPHEVEVRAVIDERARALRAKDAAAVVRHHAAGFVQFSLAPPLISTAADAKGLEAWFATWQGPLGYEIHHLKVAAGDDVAFCHWLTEHVGVAAIPLSVFCADPFPHKLIRLCFAKQDATLDAAAERLCRL